MNTDAPKLVTLSCPSCGAKLEITPTLNRFACAYCGQEHIVNRTVGTISLSPVVEAIHQVKTGVDKTAAELAIVRLQKEIYALQVKKQNIRVENQNILYKYPKPRPGGDAIFSIIFGFGVIILGIGLYSGGQENDTTLLATLSIGALLILIGMLPILKLPQKTLNWKKSVTSQIKNLDARINEIDRQIAGKQTELERNQNLVRS
jgi:DNA-directed RNA polymerase subunit RPC12/RpoP